MSIAFCELLQKNWRFRDENGAVLDQLQLLFPGEPLDGPFPPEGGGAVRRLLEALASPEFRERLERLGGYTLERPGRVRRHF